ncbi:MAG: ABC transporter ATP-binding protein [Alphaproteobacteria bacterium]|nr:ABC transporter ATP-binding protein [Alphaproteobacteria bacterium]
MTALAVAGLSLRLGAFTLGDLSFTLAANEILVVLGPNGAGKSVMLETIAGFHRPARGRILIGGRDVTALPPEQRRVGFLVQNFGLFSHLTVAQNVALAAKARRGVEDGHRVPNVTQLLERFGIAHLTDASPLVLSPGEKQRTALARAEASHPDLFLLDEPFSALDTKARDELRTELGRFLREVHASALFVTHDYIDVAALGDRVAVMHDGKIIQLGTIAEVFRRPSNRIAADILGIENLLNGQVETGNGRLLCIVVAGATFHAEIADGTALTGEVCVAVRAEDVRLARSGHGRAATLDNRLAGKVIALQPLGALTKVTLDCGFRLVASLMTRDVAELGLFPGAAAVAVIPVADVHVLAP